MATTIEVYANGATSPTASLSDPSAFEGFGVAVDANHNVFWSVTSSLNPPGEVIEFPGGQMPGVVLPITTVGFPGGPIVDSSGNLLVPDQGNASISEHINVYAPPYTGPPTSAIAINGESIFCAHGHLELRLYCADVANASVDAYVYPSGQYIYSYTNGLSPSLSPVGIANQPPAPL